TVSWPPPSAPRASSALPRNGRTGLPALRCPRRERLAVAGLALRTARRAPVDSLRPRSSVAFCSAFPVCRRAHCLSGRIGGGWTAAVITLRKSIRSRRTSFARRRDQLAQVARAPLAGGGAAGVLGAQPRRGRRHGCQLVAAPRAVGFCRGAACRAQLA